MSAINLRILQDSDIENYGTNKALHDLLEEVRNILDSFIVKNNQNQRSQGISNRSNSITNIQNNNNNSNNNNNNNNKFQFQNNNVLLKPSERLMQSPKLINQSTSVQTTTVRKPIESSFIDVKKTSLKDLATLLTRRRDIHIQVIKQISYLYEVSCRSNESLKSEFLQDLCNGTTCLKSLLSFLSLHQPAIDSHDYQSQIESIKLISILTENDQVKTFIKSHGDISTIVSVLQWSHNKSPLYDSLNLHLITVISNLSTQEQCAVQLRKSGAIKPLFTIAQNDSNQLSLRILALNTLIIFSSYSNPKISETIIDSKESLSTIIKQIVRYCTPSSKSLEPLSESLSIKFLDLLYQLSDCPKTRAIAWECGIDDLVSLIKLSDIYPVELNKGNYFKISNTLPEDAMVLQRVTLQCKVLQCLEKLSRNEINVSKIGMASTYTILSYLRPLFSIPFDLFRWNNSVLEKLLKFAYQILQDDNFKQVFIEKDACSTMVNMIQSADYFTPEVLLSCAHVLGQIVTPKKSSSSSRIFISVDKIIGSDVIPSLLKLYKSFPYEKSLQLLLCKVFKHLGARDENKQVIFSEGGFQLLHSLLSSKDLELILSSLDSLSVLSLNKFMRKVIRLVGSIPLLIEKVSVNNLSIQKYSIKNIYNISLDIEGLDLLLDFDTGVSPLTLNSLLYLNDSEIQLYSLKTIGNLIMDDPYLELFIKRGGIPSLLNSLYSNDENVQLQVLIILNKIIQKDSAQEASIRGGIVDKLKKLSTHENITRRGSILVQNYKALLLSVISIPQHKIDEFTPKPLAISEPIKVIHKSPPKQQQYEQQSQSSNSQNVNKRYSPPPLNKQQIQQQQQQSITIVTSPPISNNNSPIISNNKVSNTSTTPPDFKKIENVLGKLNELQLRELIIEIVRQNNSVSDLLPGTIRNILGNPLQQQQQQQINISSNNTTPMSSPSPPSKPLPTNITKNTNNLIKSSSTSPPSINQLQQQIKNTLGNGGNLKPVANRVTPPLAKPNTGNGGYTSFVDELKSKVGNNKLILRHIDTESEMENRRKDKLMEKNNTILKDIVSHAQKRNATLSTNGGGGGNKKILIDSSVIQGMKIWKKDFDLWKQEVIILFRKHELLVVLLFKILESLVDFPFKEAMEISNFQSDEKLSQILLRIGFNIKSSTFIVGGGANQSSDNQITEYISIIKPTGIPIKLMLSLIIDYMN